MKANRDRIIAFVVAHLPEDLGEREQLLKDALTLCGRNEPIHERIETMLTFLYSHRQQQLEFATLFGKAANPNGDGAFTPKP